MNDRLSCGIVALDISCDSDRAPSLAKVMYGLGAASGGGTGEPLELRAAHRTAVERTAVGAISHARSIGRPSLRRVLGPRIGDLDVVYQLSKARAPDTLLRSWFTSPLSPASAIRAIELAVEVHNARMPDLHHGGFSIAQRT